MLIAELGYGGAESAFVRLARELARRHEVDIAVFKERYAVEGYTATDLPQGLRIHRLDHGNPGRVRRWLDRLRRLRTLKRELRVDATISFLTGPNLLNAVARGPGLTIVSVRGSRRYEGHSTRLLKWVYRWLVDPVTHTLADAVVCVSEGVRREIGGRRAKFRTIRGYVDAEALIESAPTPIEPHLEPLAGQPVIVAAGRLSREKGFQHLIHVFAKVRERVPGAKLLLIGDGPLRSDLEDLCRKLALNSEDGLEIDRDIMFLGYRSDPHRYFRLAKAFVVSSASEGFPNVLVEALAAGVPVVAGDVPWGTREAMGLPPDPQGRPFPRREPLNTEYGVLMPRIDDPAHHAAWARVLEAQLGRPVPKPAEVARRRIRVRELSCESAAAKWETLIEELAP